MMAEWRVVPGWPLEVSDEGQVRRIGETDHLNQWANPDGYVSVHLYHKGRSRKVSVHVLVLEVFVGPRPPDCHGDHINGDTSDNCLENLRWYSAFENVRQNSAKLSYPEAREMRERYAEGETQQSLADDFGISRGRVSDLVRGVTYPRAGGPITKRSLSEAGRMGGLRNAGGGDE